jgi:two-component system NtrC family sensor kinase
MKEGSSAAPEREEGGRRPEAGSAVSEELEASVRALQERPLLSIRLQIYCSIALSFLVILGITVANLFTIYAMEKKIRFLEISTSCLFELQQARRYEKNHFLHGTNLGDALESVETARKIIVDNRQGWEETVGRLSVEDMLAHLVAYHSQLLSLIDLEKTRDRPEYAEGKRIAELEVRQAGQVVISAAEELMSREERALNEMILTSRKIHVYSLIGLILLVSFITYLLGRRILRPLQRFLTDTQPIAEGNMMMIRPTRRFRDEFSTLAVAINRMMAELDRRQHILIESHKLRAVGTLTAGVAHELNNPINNITLTAHMLLEDQGKLSDEEQREMIGDVIQEADRSKKIVRALLDFARESQSSTEALDLGQVLKETLRLANNEILRKGIDVDCKIMPGLPRVFGDKQQLCQVFLNLMINAVEVTGRNGKLQILLVPAEDPLYVELKVTDFGPGIPDHILPAIFDPFFTTKGKRGGTGLGLSVSKGIIARHGGEIRVNTQMGKGSTFVVSLPVSSFTSSFGQERTAADLPSPT